MLLLPKSEILLKSVQTIDKCYVTGQTRSYIGRLHAIVKFFCTGFGHIRVERDCGSMLCVFLLLIKTLFQKEGATRCQAPPPHPWFRSAALQDLIRNKWFCSYALFFPRVQWMIQRLSEVMSTGLVRNNFSRNPSKISFHMKTNLKLLQWLITARNLQSIKTFLTLELSKFRKSGSWRHLLHAFNEKQTNEKQTNSVSLWPL